MLYYIIILYCIIISLYYYVLYKSIIFLRNKIRLLKENE